VALIGTYEPRKCGIATFTRDLRTALTDDPSHPHTQALALDDIPGGYPYPPEVRFQIQANQPHDYRLAAEVLNINQIDLVLLQHEYGIFGGPAGHLILNLIRRLRMPVMTTLHTVLAEPTRDQSRVLAELVKLSDRLVVMCDKARDILENYHDVPSEKIAVIPHGIPDVSFVDPSFHKDQFGLEGRTVLMTFGLLSPSKGLEVAIRALPEIVKKHPDVVYVILGTIHPNIFKREGNAYLVSLEQLADRLGVRDNIVFANRFVTQDELCRYLGAADVYVIPYPNKAQITSGTLANAMGTGKAVVSTPFWHAVELLADDRGRFFDFGDSNGLACEVNKLLDDPSLRNDVRKRAYLSSRKMVWNQVARSYLQLGADVLAERRENPRPVSHFQLRSSEHDVLPEINLKHLFALTDDTGIFQHAIYAVPDRFHGYCVDDNSRALIAAVNYYAMQQDEAMLPLVNRYISFLHNAFDPQTGRFRNFMSYDRKWLDDIGSDDVQGRSLWALGTLVPLAPNEALLSFASRLFCQALPAVENLPSPRAWALTLLGIHAYLKRFTGDVSVRRVADLLAQRLFDLFQENKTEDWPWFEDILTYDNAHMPQALILAGVSLDRPDMLRQGIESLEWLYQLQVTDEGAISLIGNQGWLKRDGDRARFDQQPIDAQALTEACADAFSCTQNPLWKKRARRCLRWFIGNNDTQSVLVDYATGGCRDGLHPSGPNLNEGAESTLAWLLALMAVHELEHESDVLSFESGFDSREKSGNHADKPLSLDNSRITLLNELNLVTTSSKHTRPVVSTKEKGSGTEL
jgi:glycosyltransferase involved in cell wall biosynthesis